MMEVKLFDNYQDYLAQLPSTVTEDISSKVSEILEEVRNHGDSALKKLTYRFDGIELDSIRVQPEDLQSALKELDPELRKVLEQAAENIRTFHQRQKTESQLEFSEDGTMLGWKISPVSYTHLTLPPNREE